MRVHFHFGKTILSPLSEYPPDAYEAIREPPPPPEGLGFDKNKRTRFLKGEKMFEEVFK